MIIYVHNIPEERIKTILDAYYEATGVMPWYLDPLKTDKIEFSNSKLVKESDSGRTIKTKFFGDDIIKIGKRDKPAFKEHVIDHKQKLFGNGFASATLEHNDLYIAAKNSKLSVAFVETNGIKEVIMDSKNSAIFYLEEAGNPKKSASKEDRSKFIQLIEDENEMKAVEVGENDEYQLIVSKISKAFSSVKISEDDAINIGRKNSDKEESINVYTGSKLVEISKSVLKPKESKAASETTNKVTPDKEIMDRYILDLMEMAERRTAA